MIYQILNKLFGWHYAAVNYGGSYQILRVRKTIGSTMFVMAYGNLIPLDNERRFIPLTFKGEL